MEEPAGSLGAALISTRPTDLGWKVLYASGALLLFGYATERASLFAGASLLLGLYAVGHLGTAYAARSLRIAWDCPSRVHASEPFGIRLVLRNAGLAGISGIEVSEPAPSRDRTLHLHPLLEAGASAELEIPGIVRRRGFHRLPPPRVVLRWPFLLAESRRSAGEERELLAYPRRVPVPSRALRSGIPETSSREQAAVLPRGGELLRGVREWSPGDPARAIAWRASARHGTLLTREFEREDSGRSLVLLDADPRDLPAATRSAAVERACSLAASLVLRLRSEGRRVAFGTRAPEPVFVPSAAAPAALGRVLETLSLLEPPARRTPRQDPLGVVPAAALRGSRVILVRAAIGPARSMRDPRGFEVLTIPSLHATYRPEVPR
jgi:uncharacterized protein (DUF58 family)